MWIQEQILKIHAFKGDWIMCSKFAHYNLGGGGAYVII